MLCAEGMKRRRPCGAGALSAASSVPTPGHAASSARAVSSVRPGTGTMLQSATSAGGCEWVIDRRKGLGARTAPRAVDVDDVVERLVAPTVRERVDVHLHYPLLGLCTSGL
jgi:hypothetical protein